MEDLSGGPNRELTDSEIETLRESITAPCVIMLMILLLGVRSLPLLPSLIRTVAKSAEAPIEIDVLEVPSISCNYALTSSVYGSAPILMKRFILAVLEVLA